MSVRWHGGLTIDSRKGIQKFHVSATPRVGGISIFLGSVAALLAASEDIKALFQPIVVASIPAFAFGLLEDLTKRVGITARLAACLLSGVLGCILTGAAIVRTGVPGFDEILAVPIFSVTLTVLAVGGMANAVNLLDGFHGLAAGVAIVSFLTAAFIGVSVGDYALATVAIILAATTAGFLVVNFPFGKIFLGDGGAYFLGLALGWISVLLIYRNPSVNPWTVLLICSLPVVETCYTVFRRLSRGANPALPDRYHLHSLVRLRLERFTTSPLIRNCGVAPILWVVAILPCVIATVTWQDQLKSMMAVATFCTLYICIHRALLMGYLKHKMVGREIWKKK
jgi:UDP-N-acetylmuramyl pentapeptide phosphotransferase/UDP-N-acetylglucosamine-1-phosphate transferase